MRKQAMSAAGAQTVSNHSGVSRTYEADQANFVLALSAGKHSSKVNFVDADTSRNPALRGFWFVTRALKGIAAHVESQKLSKS